MNSGHYILGGWALDYRHLDGARARNRTENLGIKSPLLCQLSYAGASADFDRSRPWILLP